ncbi:MAG: hypothetical protein AAF383_31670 [Cyanobacteria bacterium P01_A01_bin.83]
MGHIQAVQLILDGAPVKFIVDCCLDAVIFHTDFKVTHESLKSTRSQKVSLSKRHKDYLSNYVASLHIDATTAINLILGDYFNGTETMLKTPLTVKRIKPLPQLEKEVLDKPSEDTKGASLLSNLKR